MYYGCVDVATYQISYWGVNSMLLSCLLVSFIFVVLMGDNYSVIYKFFDEYGFGKFLKKFENNLLLL